jgi:glycosyltransferase involved in cell wall biosynthesis
MAVKVAIISGSRTVQPMGMETAESHLVGALRQKPDGVSIDLRVVGGRSGRRYARSMRARWVPARPGHLPHRAVRSADLIHLLGLEFPPPSRTPYVLTIHDLAGLKFADEAPLPEWTLDAVARAARLITPSRFTAEELKAVLDVPPEKVRVVVNGPGQPVSPDTEPLSSEELAALGVEAPFVLRMGGYTERKNVSLLLDAWPKIRRDSGLSLVLAGPPQPKASALLRAAASLDGVAPLGYVPAVTLTRLLRSASLLVSTSTYEGFGLPPLEAMRAGVPVVAVHSEAVAEVCGDAVILVADEKEALTAAVVGALHEAGLRERLVRAGLRRAQSFTWDRAADHLLSVYREVDDRPA